MTVVVSNEEQLKKVRSTDSIVFVREGIAQAINSSLVATGECTLEEYAIEHGWIPQSAPMPEIQPRPKLLQWLKGWIGFDK